MSKSKKDFIALNIERAYLEEYKPKYTANFSEKQKIRFAELLRDIEAHNYRQETVKNYNQIYGDLFGAIDASGERKGPGKLQELEDGAENIDPDLLECFSKEHPSVTVQATSKVMDKDLVLEYNECRSRLREIDEKLYVSFRSMQGLMNSNSIPKTTVS